MKKTIYNKVRAIGLLLLAAAAMPLLTACTDDERAPIGSGDDCSPTPMAIKQIYLEDADAKDSITDRPVEFARLGQLIRIEGEGFYGVKKVLINGYETYFNNALMTDNNLWVTLNSNTPISEAADSVRNTITLVKEGGVTLTYPFTIRAASPQVTSIDNALPQAGETVRVIGANLQETTSVTLPDGTVITDGITSDPDGEWYSFVMPDGDHGYGSLIAEGANGTSKSPAYFNNNTCYIINFDGLGVQGGWSATFKAEDLVDDPLASGRGKVVQIVPNSVLDEGGVKAGVASIKGFWTAGNDEPTDDWSRMLAYIDGAAALDTVALQFDVYCPYAWDLTGQLTITLQNNLSAYGYGSANTKFNKSYDTYRNQAYAWVPWFNREDGTHQAFSTGERWQTVTIPLNNFGNYTSDEVAWTFQRVIDDRNAGSYRNFGFVFSNGDVQWDSEAESPEYPSQLFNQKVYVDNFRIVPCATYTVSDF